jgi:acyl-Coa thioesterase superfamily protein/acyl-CoA thioesterase superfamily protein
VSSTQFDDATAVTRVSDARYGATVDPQWSIGGRPNGGYLMAILARAACVEVSRAESADGVDPVPVDPLAVSAAFPSSPEAGEVELTAEVVRRGRAFSTVHARMAQDGVTQVDAMVTCGRVPAAGATKTVHDGTTPPQLPPIEECFELPTQGPGFEVRLMSVVRQQLDPAVLGWTRGQYGGAPEVRGYVSLADGREPDPLSLVLVVDAAPPPTFALGVRGWIPTLQISAWVRQRPAPGPLVVRSRPSLVLTADDGTGFTDETCEIWDSTGALVASGTQLAGLRHA